MIFTPIIFNFILVNKFKKYNIRRVKLAGALISVFTTLVFIIQYAYRDFIYGHFMGVSDSNANISYSSTLILFSLIAWELFLNQDFRIKKSS